MNIEQDIPGRLKVSLAEEDMSNLNITFDQLDFADTDSRHVLMDLLEVAGKVTGFRRDDSRMLIEVFPAPFGGCIIYFTKLLESTNSSCKKRLDKLTLKKTDREPYIYEFQSTDDVIDAIKMLSSHSEKIKDCMLYLLEGHHYALVMHVLQKHKRLIRHIMDEYGQLQGHSDTVAAYIHEHGKILSRNPVRSLKASPGQPA